VKNIIAENNNIVLRWWDGGSCINGDKEGKNNSESND
jgi:hypothetical protein